MVAFFGRDARQAAHVSAGCPAGTTLVLCGDWSTFDRHARVAACVVVWLEWLGRADDLARLRVLRARLPEQPVVLITLKDADNARHLKDLRVEEVLWQDELPHAFWPAVARAESRGVLGRVASAFQGAAMAAPLRRGLDFACRSATPVPRVSLLAGAAGCDRRTLWRHWRDAVGARPTPTLQDALDWLLLLRAAQRKTGGVSWREIADEVGVHEHTLGRLARRLAGESLRSVAELRGDGLLARFGDAVLAVLAPLGEPRLGEPALGERPFPPHVVRGVDFPARGPDPLPHTM
jgi:hypothetical protein